MNSFVHRRALLGVLATACAMPLALSPLAAQAQTAWPTKALTIVVPGAAGGTSQAAAFTTLVDGDRQRWGDLIRSRNLSLD